MAGSPCPPEVINRADELLGTKIQVSPLFLLVRIFWTFGVKTGPLTLRALYAMRANCPIQEIKYWTAVHVWNNYIVRYYGNLYNMVCIQWYVEAAICHVIALNAIVRCSMFNVDITFEILLTNFQFTLLKGCFKIMQLSMSQPLLSHVM